MGSRSRTAAALAAAIAWSGLAQGQAAVTWKAPEGCPPDTEVIEKATRLLGYSLVQHPTPIQFDAEVSQGADQRWRLVLTMTHEGGATRRSLDGESCQAVAEAAAAAIALALKPPEAEPEPAPAAPAEEATAEAPEPPPPEPATKPSAPPTPRRAPSAPRLGVGARLVAGVDFFTFPASAFDLEASAGLRIARRWQVEAFGLWLPTQRSSVGDADADFELLGGGARGCHLPTEWLVGCLGLEVASVRARGQNVTRSRAGNALWVAPEVDVVVLRPLFGPWSLALEGAASVPVLRTEFQISGLAVHELPVATGRLGLGVDATWQ